MFHFRFRTICSTFHFLRLSIMEALQAKAKYTDERIQQLKTLVAKIGKRKATMTKNNRTE